MLERGAMNWWSFSRTEFDIVDFNRLPASSSVRLEGVKAGFA